MRSSCRFTPPARACSAQTATSAKQPCRARSTSSVTWAAPGSARPFACSSPSGTRRLLLVIDSLDEAHGSDERLRQADTLPWRIVLTSRPSSWNHQLVVEEENDSHRIGELQPLRYPDDVDSFVHRWFAKSQSRRRYCRPVAPRPMLIRKAYDAVPEGGALIVYETIIDDDRSKNAFGLMMSLNMLIETPAGFDYTGADCQGWMKEAGFRETRVEHLVGRGLDGDRHPLVRITSWWGGRSHHSSQWLRPEDALLGN